jgi:hypothetical protein
VSVTDTGTGMSGEVLKCSSPFFDRGTGSGSACARGGAATGGPHFGVRSRVGHGRSIEVFLPRAQELTPVGSSVES